MPGEQLVRSVAELVSRQMELLEHLSADLRTYKDVFTNKDELGGQLQIMESLLSDMNPFLQERTSKFHSDCQRKVASKTIARLPEQVLQIILAHVIYDKKAKWRLPFSLMRVCCLWKSALLHTRWPFYHISLEWSPAAIEAAWCFLSKQLKHTPKHLVIAGITEKTQNSFELLQLCRLQPLHILEIRTNSNLSETAMCALVCSCRELRFNEMIRVGTVKTNIPLDDMLTPFTGVVKVSFRFTGWDPWNPWQHSSKRYSGIRKITVSNARDLPLVTLFGSAPSLEVLELADSSMLRSWAYSGRNDTTLLANSLKALKIFGHCDYDWMSEFQAPNLVHLYLAFGTKIEHIPGVRAFVSSIPALKHLDIGTHHLYSSSHHYRRFFSTVAQCCPKLESLSLSNSLPDHRYSQEALDDLQTMELGLKTLDLREAKDFSVERVESLVRARCLPKAHALSTMDPSLSSLPPLELIFAHEDRPQIEEVIRSVPCFQSATLNLRDWTDPFDVEHTGIVLKWV